MSAHFVPFQMRTRASLARLLAQMTVGLGLSTFAAMTGDYAHAQSCDRCGGVTAPSCGCEHAKGVASKTKSCNCQCAPKPSLGEKLLSHFDRVGDRIEAKALAARSSKKCQCDQKSPTCGCEPTEPSCGFEYHSNSTPFGEPPISFSYQQPPLPKPSVGQHAPSASGTLSDRASTSPVDPRTTAQGAGPIVLPKSMSENQVQRVPFEQRKPVPDHSRIPAEPFAAMQATPDTLKLPPAAPPPSLKPRQSTPISKPVPPTEQSLPDVLVDPFKDDASTRRPPHEADVQLSSAQNSPRNSLYLVPGRKQSINVETSSGQPGMPASLTPSQRQAPSQPLPSGLEFEATETAQSESAQVIRSSYMETVPVKVSRKSISNAEPDDTPQVSKVKVPLKR